MNHISPIPQHSQHSQHSQSSIEDMLKQYHAASFNEQMLIAILVLNGEAIGKTKLFECTCLVGMTGEDGKAYTMSALSDTLSRMRHHKILLDVAGAGFTCPDALTLPVIHHVIDKNMLESLCGVIEKISPIKPSWSGEYFFRTGKQAIARLRLTLLRGAMPSSVHPWLDACAPFYYKFKRIHPYVLICGQPFDPVLFKYFHPAMQAEVMAALLDHAVMEPQTAQPLRDWTEHYLAHTQEPNIALVFSMAEHLLLCGRLNDAAMLIDRSELRDHTLAQFIRSAILLLRGDHLAAVAGFDAALKALRKASGKRSIYLKGICGYLYVLAMLRSNDPKNIKSAETWLNLALRNEDSIVDSLIYAQLDVLHQVQAGTMKAQTALQLPDSGNSLLPQVFQSLLYYWLGLPQLQQADKKTELITLYQVVDAAGFHFIAAQFAGLLAYLGVKGYDERIALYHQQYGLSDLMSWFERQESWQRQLSALMNLQAPGAQSEQGAQAKAQQRLIWLLAYEAKSGFIHIEPREQTAAARGTWSKGRPIALKRLQAEAAQIPFLTPQDVQVAATIHMKKSYYGTVFEIDPVKAIAALINHPLVFLMEAPTVKVELLRGEMELLIKESKDARNLVLSLQPVLEPNAKDVVVIKETPSRLRITHVTNEHRRIAAILGSSMLVPKQAKQQVLDAISAISSLLTVQSDIGGGVSNAEQIEADARLRAHLLPNQTGLRLQLLVRPFSSDGPYYPPGQGAENVIAEIAGKRLQACRNLAQESKTAQQIIAACPILKELIEGKEGEKAHGECEWLLDDPESCLELLLQLQEQEQEQAGQLLIAWPEGEKFKVSSRTSASKFNLSITSGKDWFAASGELRIDENHVLDLRKLLDLVKQSSGRFIALGDQQFLALTEEFRRQLADFAAFSEPHGKGGRVHPLAAFALEELAGDVTSLKVDKEWKQHLQRLQELDNLELQASSQWPVPTTLQAELRDYQVTGFQWLSRLAHWGVGACLADDMGLGKTLQILALLLARAPDGPALVIAPTSVCTNWISEASRFAPTLNIILFGSGDRGQTLAQLQAFDVVIVSYGLLQQEAELFAGVHWHTVVLDEAQAIKNAQTKRSQAVMALSGDFRLIATGTPLENHLAELWNLFRFINPGLLGSMEQFNQRYAGPIERQQDVSARNRLRKLIQPFMLRRTKTQVLTELPPRTEIIRQVDLSPEESALYEALRRSAVEKLAETDASPGQKQLQILAEIMKLRRMCCNPQLVAPELKLGSSKLAVFGELLDELLENRHKALVFSQFVDHLKLVRDYLDERGIAYQYLDGATPMSERKLRVDAFQAGKGDVFLISLKAGGTGLNLTAADYVIHMDPWWNPAVEDQASDRSHRMGQQRPVTIYRLVAKNTIEEAIVDLHKHKRDLADSLLEGSDIGGKMSAQEMLRLLQEELRG